MRGPQKCTTPSPEAHDEVSTRLFRTLPPLYFIVVVTFAGLLWGAGDSWWPATVLLFGPRWPILVPMMVIIPSGVWIWRRTAFWLLLTVILAVGPFMGMVIPWRTAMNVASGPPSHTLRLVTYNCGQTEDDRVIALLESLQPDILTLNEWHGSRSLPEELTGGRHVGRAGGNVVISRFPIEKTERLQSEQLKPWEQRAVRCQVRTPMGVIQVVSVHLETPRHGLAEVRYRRWDGADEMRRNTDKRRFEAELTAQFANEFSGLAMMMGDFNMPVESRIYRRYWSHWQNAFSRAGFGFGYTKYTRWFGVRIDHILVSSHWRVHSAWVGPDLGGDHRPLIAEISLRS